MGVNKIGNAAVSWVNLQWVSYIAGVVAFILLVIFFFVPHWQSMKESERVFKEDFEETRQRIKDAHKEMDERSKEFDKQKSEIENFRKKNFQN